jgi:hypothetical protein
MMSILKHSKKSLGIVIAPWRLKCISVAVYFQGMIRPADLSGVGSFLTFYAISLTSPAIVDAISGLRYVTIFVGAYGVTKLRPLLAAREFFRVRSGWQDCCDFAGGSGISLIGTEEWRRRRDQLNSPAFPVRSFASPLQQRYSAGNQDRC